MILPRNPSIVIWMPMILLYHFLRRCANTIFVVVVSGTVLVSTGSVSGYGLRRTMVITIIISSIDTISIMMIIFIIITTVLYLMDGGWDMRIQSRNMNGNV